MAEVDETGVDTGKVPTKKLTAASVTAVILFVVSLFTDVDQNLEQALNVLVPIVLAYFVKNDPTPGGVPDARVVTPPVARGVVPPAVQGCHGGACRQDTSVGA
jgi:hypothetical protein